MSIENCSEKQEGHTKCNINRLTQDYVIRFYPFLIYDAKTVLLFLTIALYCKNSLSPFSTALTTSCKSVSYSCTEHSQRKDQGCLRGMTFLVKWGQTLHLEICNMIPNALIDALVPTESNTLIHCKGLVSVHHPPTVPH